MAAFTLRRIRGSETLGETLRRHRESIPSTVEEVSNATDIPAKHLTSLEAGRYADLPGDVYIRNYLKRYAQFLSLNAELILGRYDRERSAHPDIPSAVGPPGPAAQPAQRGFVLEPRLFRRVAIILVILTVLTYLGFEVQRIVGPPVLTVSSPASDVTVTAEELTVTGQTESESRVFLNGQPISVNRDGRFSETVDLQVGVNTLQIRAEKKNGKTTTVTRTVLREVSND